ncbi:uncharacterized protein M421DRAFT_68075 [Didymella exigua CBS 183.55]|uniref:Uncharacterized protein n=1 Tax=Didymella exigua CBS 183.55 TaxID=1150837 RepID=A0A6A5RFM1_9PLEO|nr:uncharacterized protein M421DRAFT_68075 [Didymella exigua CBS 183.55]KAF1926263.1 hypothetical protein M421DRAFT_68075 [Didymella exigua CBS 183.55]
MPVYHARSIAVRLGSMPLAETTTSDVVLKKGEVAKRQSEAAEKKILRSGYLNEKRVLFPGDRDGFELNWLGNAPFMQTQVSPDFTQSSAPDQDPKTAEHSRLQALTLHVKLSDKAFLSGFNNKTHLKIEVLFNGQLSTCSLIHTNDIRSGAKSLHQIFAGYRIDFLAERPWILLPPFTTADGGVRRFRKTITPAERWEEISAAILKEAEERGTDKCGESPPSAAFLHAMASMDMPECVKTMQKPGGRKFGLVDVVITAGFGSKVTTGTNYLKRPHRLRDSNYVVRSAIARDEERDAFRVFEAYHSPLPEPELHALQAGSLNPALSSMPLSERTDTRGMIGGLPSYKLPNELPNLIPQTPPFHEHSRPAQFATPLRSSPPTFQLRSSSPDKSIAADGLNHYQHSVLINRLVITGRNGKPLVDHVWKLPQHIIVNRKNGNSAFVGGPAQTPTSSCSETGAQSRAREKNHSPNKTSWATFRTALPPEQWQSNNTGQPIHDQRRDSVQDGQVEQSMNVPLPYLRRHQGPVNEAIPINSRIDVPEMIAPFRRNCPSNALPGIQDLKATSFLFDDPGEVLREAARMRRSRSPTKPAATAHVLHVQPPAHPETQRSSSPLSSVPSSPLAEKPAEVADHTGIPNQLTQLDGSPERTLPATSPRKLPTPSLKKLSFVAPKLQGPDPATPQLSISQKSKKRKALHQSPTRPPRSPGRLKTVDNPPLNDDCVIALAESFDKKEERGVLRQVKGERQGVFREEYVVLAVRFFIAGD